MNRLPEKPTTEISDLLAGYALGALSPDEREFVARNLPRKPEWRRELEQYQQVTFALAHDAEEQDVPVRVRAAMLAQIDAIESDVPLSSNIGWNATLPAQDELTQEEPRRSWARRLPRIALATAMPVTIVAIVFVMYTVIVQNQISDQQQELAQFQQQEDSIVEVLTSDQQTLQVIDLVESNQAPLARGSLFIDNQSNAAVLVARDLPLLDESQTYIVWAVTDTVNGEYAQIGVLEAGEDGTGQITIDPPDAFERYTNISITIESTPDVAEPSGPEVMSGGI